MINKKENQYDVTIGLRISVTDLNDKIVKRWLLMYEDGDKIGVADKFVCEVALLRRFQQELMQHPDILARCAQWHAHQALAFDFEIECPTPFTKLCNVVSRHLDLDGDWEKILRPVLELFPTDEQDDLINILDDEKGFMFMNCFTLSLQCVDFNGQAIIDAEGLCAEAIATAERLRRMVSQGVVDVHDREDIEMAAQALASADTADSAWVGCSLLYRLLDDLPRALDWKEQTTLRPEHCRYLTRAASMLSEARSA